VFKVHGDSANDARIFPRDLLIVDSSVKPAGRHMVVLDVNRARSITRIVSVYIGSDYAARELICAAEVALKCRVGDLPLAGYLRAIGMTRAIWPASFFSGAIPARDWA
jgi:hypothetical protein